MRDVAVAVPAGFSLSYLGHHVICSAVFDEFGGELLVAAHAVVHDYLRAGVVCSYHLRLVVSDEGGEMPDAVGAFEGPFFDGVLVRHVAVVTGGIAAMRTVHPCSVVWRHDMAVHASCWVITEVAACFHQVESQ